jgi:hypothetical protein
MNVPPGNSTMLSRPSEFAIFGTLSGMLETDQTEAPA